MSTTFSFTPYHMRLIDKSDIDDYFRYGFENASEESRYFTGGTANHTKEQIISYVDRIIDNPTRFDFLIFENSKILGEAVLMDIMNQSAHFRICIFNKQKFSKGIGYSATHLLLNFAFKELHLDSIDLEVFPFNKRGIALYHKIGFTFIKQIKDTEAKAPYRDINIMQLKKEDYLLNVNAHLNYKVSE